MLYGVRRFILHPRLGDKPRRGNVDNAVKVLEVELTRVAWGRFGERTIFEGGEARESACGTERGADAAALQMLALTLTEPLTRRRSRHRSTGLCP
jgi:hypothetical protein